MPDLLIGKVIFEPSGRVSARNPRQIVELSVDEISVIKEFNVGGKINRTVASTKLTPCERNDLEGCFFDLTQYGTRIDHETNESRLDYLLYCGERRFYLINTDGPSVDAWISILEFIKEKIGIDLLPKEEVSNLVLNKNESKDLLTDEQLREMPTREAVVYIIKNYCNDIFTIDDIQKHLEDKPHKERTREENHRLNSRIHNVLYDLCHQGILAQIDRRHFDKRVKGDYVFFDKAFNDNAFSNSLKGNDGHLMNYLRVEISDQDRGVFNSNIKKYFKKGLEKTGYKKECDIRKAAGISAHDWDAYKNEKYAFSKAILLPLSFVMNFTASEADQFLRETIGACLYEGFAVDRIYIEHMNRSTHRGQSEIDALNDDLVELYERTGIDSILVGGMHADINKE